MRVFNFRHLAMRQKLNVWTFLTQNESYAKVSQSTVVCVLKQHTVSSKMVAWSSFYLAHGIIITWWKCFLHSPCPAAPSSAAPSSVSGGKVNRTSDEKLHVVTDTRWLLCAVYQAHTLVIHVPPGSLRSVLLPPVLGPTSHLPSPVEQCAHSRPSQGAGQRRVCCVHVHECVHM